MWKFPGQGSNQYHSSDNAGSLTHWATTELHYQFGFILRMQGGFNTCKSINVTHHINKWKIKTSYHHFSRNHLTKSRSFHDKNFWQIKYRRNVLNIIKAICDKPTANIILNDEKLKAPRSGERQITIYFFSFHYDILFNHWEHLWQDAFISKPGE